MSTASPVPSSPSKQIPSLFFQPNKKPLLNKSESKNFSNAFQSRNKNGKMFSLGLSKTSKTNQTSKKSAVINKKDKKTASRSNTLTNNNNKSLTSLGVKSKNSFDNPFDKQTILESHNNEANGMRRNNSGLWNAFKSWNTKRKETKLREKIDPLIDSHSNVSAFKTVYTDTSSTQEQPHTDRNIVFHFPVIDEFENLQRSSGLIDSHSITELKPEENAANCELNVLSALGKDSKQFSSTDVLQWENELNVSPINEVRNLMPRSYSMSALDGKVDSKTLEDLQHENKENKKLFTGKFTADHTQSLSKEDLSEREKSISDLTPHQPELAHFEIAKVANFPSSNEFKINSSSNSESIEPSDINDQGLVLKDSSDFDPDALHSSDSNANTLIEHSRSHTGNVPLDVRAQKSSSCSAPYFSELEAIQEMSREEEKKLLYSSRESNAIV